MKQVKIQADVRQVTGKKVASLRRQGLVPANLYGPGMASVPLQVKVKSLEKLVAQLGPEDVISLKIGNARRLKSVALRKVQLDSRSGTLLHVDFYQQGQAEKE